MEKRPSYEATIETFTALEETTFEVTKDIHKLIDWLINQEIIWPQACMECHNPFELKFDVKWHDGYIFLRKM